MNNLFYELQLHLRGNMPVASRDRLYSPCNGCPARRIIVASKESPRERQIPFAGQFDHTWNLNAASARQTIEIRGNPVERSNTRTGIVCGCCESDESGNTLTRPSLEYVKRRESVNTGTTDQSNRIPFILPKILQERIY